MPVIAANETRVVVAGQGVVGLTTACCLATRGWSVEIWSIEERRPSSYAACALFLPYFGTAESPKTERWSRASWQRFSHIAEDDSSGVRAIRMMEMFGKATTVPVVLRDLTLVDSYRRDDLPQGFSYVWDFATWLIDVPIYVSYLMRLCLESGVKFESRMCTRDSVHQRSVAAVIDCTGHWSSCEFDAEDVKPVRGQAVVLPSIPLDFALGGDEFILAPRSDGLIFGSLWQEGDRSDKARDVDTRRLLDELGSWCSAPLLDQFGLRSNASDVRAVLTGVRPYLESGDFVRVDAPVNGWGPVIHNTGHGGSGVGLSWGTAEEVGTLLASLVGGPSRRG